MKKSFDNQDSNYPIVLLPKTIYKNLTEGYNKNLVAMLSSVIRPNLLALPPKPTEPESKSVESYESYKFEGLGDYIGVLVIQIIAIIALRKIDFLLFIPIGIVIFLVTGLLKIKKVTKYREDIIDKNKYDTLLADYKKKMKIWEDESKELRYENSQRMKSFEANFENEKIEFLKNAHQQILKPSLGSCRSTNSIKRGKSEIDFLEILISELKDLVKIDIQPLDRIYFPDFVLICPKTDLHIDIEIDEPYSLEGKMPIHYKGADITRNDYFLNYNWCIIRFSENQIVNQPLECIKTIKSIYSAILNMEKEFENFGLYNPVWTYEDAIVFAKKGLRN